MTWPGHARYGSRAGQVNASFLDAHHFHRGFSRRSEPYRDRVAILMFEFGTFAKTTFTTAEFTRRLDAFLGVLPGGFRYAVEIRNSEYLKPDYFATLAGHNVAHIFNAWTRMPDIGAQARLPGAFTADFTVVRALLRHGRTYEQAVKAFEPYRATQEPDPATRDATPANRRAHATLGQSAFLFVNNRLEGNAPSTIEAVASTLIA